jgi:hypothetical protein
MTICGEGGVGFGERNLSPQSNLKSASNSCVVVSGALVYQTRQRNRGDIYTFPIR